MKKIISVLMIAVLIVGVVPAFSAGAEVFYNGIMEDYVDHICLSDDNPVEYRAFYPEQSGYYSFYSNQLNGCDPYVYCYDQQHNNIGFDDDNGYDDNFNYVAYFEEGKVYYFDVGAVFDNSKEAVFQMVITRLDTKINKLELNKNYDVVPGSKKDTEYFEFTPESDGYYAFYSHQRYAFTYGVLYDSMWNELDEDDDSGNGSSFYLSYYLEKGKTYYYLSHAQMATPDYSYTVSLKPCEVICDINILSYPERMTCYEGYEEEMFEMNGLSVEFVYTDGSTVKWDYPQYDSYDNELEGTTVYTGLSQDENGKYFAYICADYAYEQFYLDIVECPVESIEVVSHSKIECYENMTGFRYTDSENKEQWFVYYYQLPSDLVMRVNYKDGTHKETRFFSDDNVIAFSYDDKQRDGEKWSVGKNPVTLEYFGKTCELYVDVLENPIENLEFVEPPQRVYYFDSNVLDENGWHCEISPKDLSGMMLRVNYKDGTNKVLTDKEYDYHSSTIGGYGYSTGVYTVEKPGMLTVTLSYCGHKTSYDVKVVEKGDVDMDFSVSILDATQIQRIVASGEEISSQTKLFADVDNDARVTVLDSTAIQRYLAGFSDTL